MSARRTLAGTLLLLASVVAAALAATEEPPLPVNAMHPPIVLRDAQGAALPGRTPSFSAEATCGQCHDSDYIRAHSSHSSQGEAPDCITCHLPGGRATLSRLALDAEGRILMPMAPPVDLNCGGCHGLVHQGGDFLEIGEDFLKGDEHGRLGNTLRTGEIFSPQPVSSSLLNLHDKATLSRPWDLHAARGLHCTDCHFAANSPKMTQLVKTGLAHLREDPRSLSLSAFLKQPDHRLQTARCRDCHDPQQTHAALAYAERHLEALACETCHVPRLLAPALRAVDRTVVTADGGPRMEFRGVTATEFRAPSTWFLTGYRPFLGRVERDGHRQFAPFNLLARWEWVTGEAGEPVPWTLVEQAFTGPDGATAPELLALLDRDGDGRLAESELVLAGEAQESVRRRLVALGVDAPRIQGRIEAEAIHHDVVRGEWTTATCASCHAADSRFNEAVALGAAPFPGGVQPTLTPAAARLLDGRRLAVTDAGLVITGGSVAGDTYVLGHDRRPWSDLLGLALFALSLLGILSHALLRMRGSRGRPRAARLPAGPRVYMYGLYERIWHWSMAGSILLLLITGFSIHSPRSLAPLGFPLAVLVHNLMAWLLLVNAGLSLFYHVATGEIRQFLPQPEGLLRRLALQALYYTRGIFAGAAHPVAKSPAKKLNPLQQLTYAGLLNLLFPLQVVTGVLLWIAGLAPQVLGPALSLAVLAPIHNLGSWLFLSFLVVHVYLTTTGSTLTSNVRAMIGGWEALEHPLSEATAAPLPPEVKA